MGNVNERNQSVLATLLRENPVVVTGLGALSAAGGNVAALWAAAAAGRVPASYAVAKIPETPARFRRLDRAAQLAWCAAAEALAQAGLGEVGTPERVGVFVGTAGVPQRSLGQAPRPSTAADQSFSAIAGALARDFGFRGPCVTVAATCASAAVAIAQGAEQILLGKIDVALVGGAEAPLAPGRMAEFAAAGVLARESCRPFDRARDGMVLGEGSGFLVLESSGHARARGVKWLANFSGWAYASDARSRTANGTAGLARVLQEACALAPGPIDYLNLHGNGTVRGDREEAEAVAQLFPGVPCSSTKPITGHCLGATPALEAIIAIAALRAQTIPPSAHCDAQDPACAISLAKTARPAELRTILSNSLGFWGQTAALLFAAPATR